MDDKLPKAVYLKHGAYYLVRKNRWIRLGENREAALKLYAEMVSGVEADYMASVYDRAKRNARNRGIAWDLPRGDFFRVVDRARGACEVSGIAFSLANETGSKRRPFAPSLDRIDSAQGYAPENVRLVCVCVNAALSDWGTATLLAMLSKARRAKRLTPPAAAGGT